MKLSGIQWVFLGILIPALVLAEKETTTASSSPSPKNSETLDVKLKNQESSTTTSVKLNATTTTNTAVGESRTGRTLTSKKIGCKGGSGGGGSDIFSGFTSIFSDFSSLFNSSSLMLPNLDLNSLSGGSDKLGLFALNKALVPTFFAIALITGLIVTAIAVLIPSIKEGSKDSIFGNMMDNLYNFMQDAISSGQQQYGTPQTQDSYGPPSDGGYSSGGYSSGGYSSPQVANTYNAPPSSGYNTPSSTYTDPSQSYGQPSRRYNYVYSQQPQQQQQVQQQQQPQYQAVQSNYLRSEKAKKK